MIVPIILISGLIAFTVEYLAYGRDRLKRINAWRAEKGWKPVPYLSIQHRFAFGQWYFGAGHGAWKRGESREFESLMKSLAVWLGTLLAVSGLLSWMTGK